LDCQLLGPSLIATALMTRILPFAVLALASAFLVACETTNERQDRRSPGGFRSPPPPSTFHHDPAPPVTEDVEHTDRGDRSPPAPTTDTAPTKPPEDVKVGELPYAKPVPGKQGFVTSPYDPYKGYIDVRGFPPGTEVKDPYSGKTFLVP
jgi:hypothetical protein